MPTQASGNPEFVRRCLEHLRALTFVRRATFSIAKKAEIDATIKIETPSGQRTLPCALKRGTLGSSSAQVLVHFARRRPGLMVFASSIGSALGDFFEQSGINFVDVAGNCHVRLGERYLARIQGRKADEKPRTDRGLRAPAYRALFALLAKPDLVQAPSRTIAADAGVSPQTANDLRHWLVEQGLLLELKSRRDWPSKGHREATALWLAGFSTVLGPELLIGRFRAQEREPSDLERRIEPVLDAACTWRYGGGAACWRMTRYYRGDRTVLYVEGAPDDLWKNLRFLRDPTGPIAVMGPPAAAAFESPIQRCVHPLLAYADLLAEGNDRAREAAGEVYTAFLADFDEAR